MTSYDETTKQKIRALRSEGLTYTEIQLSIGKIIPKTSLNYICRGIVLSAQQKQQINDAMLRSLPENRRRALLANQKIQETIAEDIRKRSSKFAKLSDREAKIALALLYLGEGSKRRSFRGLSLGNSDPKVIVIYMGLLKRCYGIEADEFKCRILYRADQDLNKLEDFWAIVTKIPRDNFYKTKYDPRTVGKPTLRPDYHGVCVLTRKGTEIQLELQTIADIIGEAMGI